MPFLTGYSYRKQISVDNSHVSADLSNFPVLVKFTADADLGLRAHSTGQNIRFTSSDGTTLLSYERVSFNVSGGLATAIFFVKVPTVSSAASTVIYCYYDNSSASDGQNKAATWTSYAGGWHMEEDPSGSAPQMLDSLGVNNGTTAGSMTSGESVAASVGRGLSFDGVDDIVQIDGIAASLTVNLTFEVIVNSTNVTLQQTLIGLLDDPSGNDAALWITRTHNDGSSPQSKKAVFRALMDGTSVIAVSTSDLVNGTPTHVAGRLEVGVGLSLFVNGVKEAFTAASVRGTPASLQLNLGKNRSGTAVALSGVLDEVAIASSGLSDAWIKFRYYNLLSGTNGITIGSEQIPSSGAGKGFLSLWRRRYS